MTEVSTRTEQRETHVAIVTGAGHGIGRATALQLAAEGAHVVVNDISEGPGGVPSAEVTAGEIRDAGGSAVAVTASVADESGVERILDCAVEAFGTVDAVVNNAGIFRQVDFENETLDGFLGVINVHLVGSFLLARGAWPLLQKSQHPRLVNVVSVSGLYGQPRMAAYSAAKAGLVGLTKTLALDGAEFGINVNAVAPAAQTGDVRTAEGARFLSPLGERRTPEHAAALIAYLASPACEVTGRGYVSAGGRYARFALGEARGWTSEHADPPRFAHLTERFSEVDDPAVIACPSDIEASMKLVASTSSANKAESTRA
ncbi:SDR family NAD(P)-dependent oxidoreductase [Rhodococcus olei]|uniref:SDR family NAD(P)-dependent oxidoreductase n=1 Tax=Rhodococcus olei TaxID=2161675 RepID=UPI0031ED9C34